MDHSNKHFLEIFIKDFSGHTEFDKWYWHVFRPRDVGSVVAGIMGVNDYKYTVIQPTPIQPSTQLLLLAKWHVIPPARIGSVWEHKFN